MNSPDRIQNFRSTVLLPALDTLAVLAWGALLFKYWLGGQLRLLINPSYFGLVLSASLLLLFLGGFNGWQWFRRLRNRRSQVQAQEILQHITLFPAGWGSGLLLLVALLGLAISPSVLTSQIALQRGVSESLPPMQVRPQAFSIQAKPEQRSLIEWVRTLSAYPEPDAYAGQPVKVTGFVIHLPHLPENFLFLSRFIITCCAVDAHPVGLPVKLEQSRNIYPPDTWLEVQGEMAVENLPVDTQTMKATPQQERQLVIVAKSVKVIPTPADPYGS
jgi:uncharacterized repeat protein (TIGR03943 family)